MISLFLIVPLFVASCQRKDEGVEVAEQKSLKIVTSLFPLYEFAKNIGKEKADVSLLLPPGLEPHGFEPKPSDILKINNADIFIYTGRFMEPWVEDILRGLDNKELVVVDTSTGITLLKKLDDHGHDHGHDHHACCGHAKGKDPHIWLDLDNAQKMVDNILSGFIESDPVNSSFYTANALSYKTKLNNLDIKFKSALSDCKNDIIIHGGHFAFGYLAKRYNLKYISAYKGFSPDAKPTPRRLIKLINKMREHDLRYIFHETLISPRVSETIARETGASLLKLHSGHNLTKEEWDRGVTFISLMEQNLENLKIGLQCR